MTQSQSRVLTGEEKALLRLPLLAIAAIITTALAAIGGRRFGRCDRSHVLRTRPCNNNNRSNNSCSNNRRAGIAIAAYDSPLLCVFTSLSASLFIWLHLSSSLLCLHICSHLCPYRNTTHTRKASVPIASPDIEQGREGLEADERKEKEREERRERA